MANTGTLYIVATPIGNLEDISRRAERVLAECDAVAAEDTRRTRGLLSYLGIKKRLISYYEPKEERAIPGIIELLHEGKSVALVTDGGTPAISDPGYRLVRAAHAAGIRVIPVPGPSALTAALSASGLPTGRVTFAGFPPPKSAARKKALAELKDRADTLVFYESPNRLLDLLADALAVLGDREAVVFREITKLYEEQVRGPVSEIIASLKKKEEIKGEITVIIRGREQTAEQFSEDEITELVREALKRSDRPLSSIASNLARETGWPRKKVYKIALKIKDQGELP
ncbi:MAG TPA: 16S rRNA (cytidine(1402)-2'-O)-methyltransferase [bacterium]|nr:16S rRNA (cytidine(1402)-2'-O)-methyltransferase [bacterium]